VLAPDILLITIKMNKRLISIGIISCSLLIFIQLTACFFELLQYDNNAINITVNMLNMILNVSMFIIIWRVLVKYYGQEHFDWLIKAMIIIMIIITMLSIVTMVKISTILLLVIVGLFLINFIISIVFLIRVMDLEKHEVKRIDYLQNYSLSFLICLIGQFVFAALVEFKKVDIKFVKHLLLMIPVLFILLFFNKIKDDIINNAST
jgi:hypothetical protein